GEQDPGHAGMVGGRAPSTRRHRHVSPVTEGGMEPRRRVVPEPMRIRVVATLDPEPERELERWRARLPGATPVEADEIWTRMRRYERGQELIVRLSVTFEVSGDGGPAQRPGPEIEGV